MTRAVAKINAVITGAPAAIIIRFCFRILQRRMGSPVAAGPSKRTIVCIVCFVVYVLVHTNALIRKSVMVL